MTETSSSMPPKHLTHKKQIVVLLDEEVHRAFKMESAERGETMQEVLAAYIEEYAAPTLKRIRKAKK